MVYPTLSDINTTEGLHNILVVVNDGTNGLMSRMLLFFIFCVVSIGSYFAMKNTGRQDFPLTFAVASFVTVIIAILMSLINGLMDGYTLAVTFGIAVLGVLWLVVSRNRA